MAAEEARGRTRRFLNQPFVETVMLALLLLGIACTLVEAGLGFDLFCLSPRPVDQTPAELEAIASQHALQNPPHALLQRRLHRTTPAQALAHHFAKVSLGRHAQRAMEPGDSVSGPENQPGAVVCEGPGGEQVTLLAGSCHILGISILCVFVAEVWLKRWVIGPEFFAQRAHVVDAVVVNVSLIFEAVLEPLLEANEYGDHSARIKIVRSVFLVFRAWRIVDVVNSVFQVFQPEAELEELKEQLDEARARIRKLERSPAKQP